jgi:hypothetical protein
MSAVIMQEGIPVPYYSQKLADAQKKYTTLEKECANCWCVFLVRLESWSLVAWTDALFAICRLARLA